MKFSFSINDFRYETQVIYLIQHYLFSSHGLREQTVLITVRYRDYNQFTSS
jgi:hypothetical protein